MSLWLAKDTPGWTNKGKKKKSFCDTFFCGSFEFHTKTDEKKIRFSNWFLATWFFFFPSWHLSLYTWHKRKTLVTQREREEEDGSKWRGLCGLFCVGGSSGDPPKRKNSPPPFRLFQNKNRRVIINRLHSMERRRWKKRKGLGFFGG